MNARRRPLLLLPLAILLVAACGPGASGPLPSGSPAPSTSPAPSDSPAPTPTPIGEAVASIEEAAAIVIASDPRFAGITALDPDVIGASSWWEGVETENGYAITITIGWGDCPAGCISRHVWTYAVTRDGNATLESETGDPLPDGSLPA